MEGDDDGLKAESDERDKEHRFGTKRVVGKSSEKPLLCCFAGVDGR
jgi:hypothetical protein